MDRDDNTVLQMTKNGPKFATQNAKYKARVITFPELYKAGNFSIRMDNVQQSDNGPYDCLIPAVDFHQRLFLNISGLYESTEVSNGDQKVET